MGRTSNRSHRRVRTTRKEAHKHPFIKKACQNFKKPLYLMRHLHTDANLVADSLIGNTFNKLKGHKKGL